MKTVFLNNFDYWKLNSDTHERIQIMSQLYSIKCYLQTPLNHASFHFSTQQVPRYHKITKFSTLCILMLFFIYFLNYSIEVKKAHKRMKTHKWRAQWILKNWRQACNRYPAQETEQSANWTRAEEPPCLQNLSLSWEHRSRVFSRHKVRNNSLYSKHLSLFLYFVLSSSSYFPVL